MLLIAITPRRPLNFGTFNSRTFIKQPCKAWTCLQLISSKHFRRHKISQNGPKMVKEINIFASQRSNAKSDSNKFKML